MLVGPFKISRPLGEGGMATVWEGVHVELGTPVAFKFMRPRTNKTRGALRFLDETRALARMNHPGVVRIFDAGFCTPEMSKFLGDVDANSPYFVMEAVSGGSIKGHTFSSWDQVQRVLVHLLDALAHAHARAVIHRDIKPGNVLIEASGLPRLTDFGISRLAHSPNSTERMTGTPSYMAPEQVGGDAHREGPWTDLYAVGCLTYWLCSGAPPFRGSMREVLEQHLNAEPPELSANFSVPAGLQQWVGTMLAKDPQARFPRAADAALALNSLGPAETVLRGTVPASDEYFPTLTVIFDDDSSLDAETSTGAMVEFSAPEPPRSWRTRSTAPPIQLMSAGPGMLALRDPAFRDREDERDAMWNALREVWKQQDDRAVAITGDPGVGRTALWRWFGRRAHELGVAYTLVFDEDIRRSMTQHLVRWWRNIGGFQGATAFYVRRGQLDDLAEWDMSQIRTLAHGESVSQAVLSAVHGRWTQRLGRDRTVLLFGATPDALNYLRTSSISAPGRRLLLAESPDAEGYDQEIKLEPLRNETIAAIVTELLGLSPKSAERVALAAEGNPALAVKIARESAKGDGLEHGDLGFEISDEELSDILASFDHEWSDTLDSVVSEPSRRALGILAHVASQFTETEIVTTCEYVGVDPSSFMLAMTENGLMSPRDDGLQFASPLARSACREAHQMTAADHEAVWGSFRGEPKTPRRRRIAAFHGFVSAKVDLDHVIDLSRQLRVDSEPEASAALLSDVRQTLEDDESEQRHALTYALAESFLPPQAYSRALEELRSLPPDVQERDDPKALILFLSVRQFEDVRDRVLEFEPQSLSETPARMIAYIWMDFGQYDRARDILTNLKPQYDKSGPYFALARLEFLRENWADAERWGRLAADGFEEIERLDGATAALDIVASARLKQGRVDDAIALYRDNLATGRRIAAPVFVQTYNLATCLIETGRPSEEVDRLLNETVSESLRRGRVDIEHAARAAQVFYALAVSNEQLAKHRMSKLESLELGPWLQPDSELHLSNALEFAAGELANRISSLLEHVRGVLASSSGD